MREHTERRIKVGFSRKPRKIFDEVEMVTASMLRLGWYLADSCLEESLGCIHLFFEREVSDKAA
ncbi:MAG: hypothetical protein ACLFSB_05105 [Chitinispirillaceae bacterium]